METQTDTQVLSSMPEERESSEPLWFREIDMSEDTDDGRGKKIKGNLLFFREELPLINMPTTCRAYVYVGQVVGNILHIE